MKLYGLPHSPYAARVRMQIRIKGQDVDICPPPLALRTEEFFAKYPIGKVPILELDDGSHIADSWAIMDYLENLASSTPLIPADTMARASTLTFARLADTALAPALFPMFRALGQQLAEEEKAAVVAELQGELVRIDRWIAAGEKPAGMTLGDLCMASNMFFVTTLMPLFGVAEPFADLPALRSWTESVQGNDVIAATLVEMDEGLKAFMAR